VDPEPGIVAANKDIELWFDRVDARGGDGNAEFPFG
jgi:hypothetical protein